MLPKHESQHFFFFSLCFARSPDCFLTFLCSGSSFIHLIRANIFLQKRTDIIKYTNLLILKGGFNGQSGRDWQELRKCWIKWDLLVFVVKQNMSQYDVYISTFLHVKQVDTTDSDSLCPNYLDIRSSNSLGWFFRNLKNFENKQTKFWLKS